MLPSFPHPLQSSFQFSKELSTYCDVSTSSLLLHCSTHHDMALFCHHAPKKLCRGHQPSLWIPFSFYSTSIVGRIMPPSKDVHVLICRTCEYVHGKRNFAGCVSELKADMIWEDYLDCWGGPNLIPGILNSGRGKQNSQNLPHLNRWPPPSSCSNQPSWISSCSFVPMSNPRGDPIDFTSKIYSKSAHISPTLLLTPWSTPSSSLNLDFCNSLLPFVFHPPLTHAPQGKSRSEM